MRSIKTGFKFPLATMVDRRLLLSVEPSSTDQGDRLRQRMLLSPALASVKDWTLKWKLAHFWEEAPINWESPSRSMRHGNMSLDLCC